MWDVSDETMRLLCRGQGAIGGVARREGWLPSEEQGKGLVRCFRGGWWTRLVVGWCARRICDGEWMMGRVHRSPELFPGGFFCGPVLWGTVGEMALLSPDDIALLWVCSGLIARRGFDVELCVSGEGAGKCEGIAMR
jgi:hypothetical protein